MDSDSLWLQKSINLSDPLDTSVESNRSSQNKSGGIVNPTELETIAMRPVTRLSDSLRQGRAGSSARLSSIANAMGGFNPFEIDELKGKLAQLNREKLRWEDASRDLERSKTELQQAREDYRALEEYTQTIKGAADDATMRAERDAKARQEAESKLLEAMRNASKEQLALKSQVDEVKKSHAHKLFEIKESMEQEKVAERARIVQEHEEILRECDQKALKLEQKITELSSKVAAGESALSEARRGFAVREGELQNQVSQLQKEVANTKATAADKAKQLLSQMESAQREHKDAMEQLKVVSAEQLYAAKEEAKVSQDSLQQRLTNLEEKYDATKEELFRTRGDVQSQQNSMKQQRAAHELAMQHAEELHSKEMHHIRSDLASAETALGETQRLLSEAQQDQRALQEKLAKEQTLVRDLSEKLQAQHGEWMTTEEKLRAALADIEARDAELDEIADVMQRVNLERDSTVKGYSDDLLEARARCDKLESDLTLARTNLSNERKAHLVADGSYRRTIAELREQLTQAAATNVSAHTEDLEAQQHLRALCDELSHRVAVLESENKTLNEELSRVACTRVEAKRPRGGLSEVPTNVTETREASIKKHRVEPAPRVFAVSGFEGEELKSIKKAIEDLPFSSIVECRSNAPLPSSVTHLVASGQLTVKLLSAAVKGCWIVPKAYVDGSAASGEWADESALGFHHQQLPLAGKAVFFSPSFKGTKHFATAKLLIDQGGASQVQTEKDADVILAVSSESARFPGCRSWETFVNEIYPVAA